MKFLVRNRAAPASAVFAVSAFLSNEPAADTAEPGTCRVAMEGGVLAVLWSSGGSGLLRLIATKVRPRIEEGY